jgi:nicotinamide-nucleotide adenylyltransferase
MRALFIGRFQPFHNGHAEIIAFAKDYDPVIAIGSAYQSLSYENPFSAGERHEMVQRALADLGRDAGACIVPVADINRHGVYARHVMDLVPPFDVVISNNAVIREIFSREGYEVIATPAFERETFKGTVIRERMASGESWGHLVPPAVARYVRDIGGVERVRRLAGTG